MNKFFKKFLFLGATGAMLTATSLTCAAEEQAADQGLFGNLLGTILSNVPEEDIGVIVDSISAIAEDEEITSAVQDLINSEEIQEVIGFATELLGNIPEEDQMKILSYLGIQSSNGSIENPNIGEEMDENAHILTFEEVEALGYQINLADNMVFDGGFLVEDEEAGNVLSMSIINGDEAYSYSIHEKGNVEFSELADTSIVGILVSLFEEEANTAEGKVGDIDATVTILSDETIGMIRWINEETDQLYQLEILRNTPDVDIQVTQEYLEEVASILTAE